MKKRLGTGITLFVALIFVLLNLPASPAWAGDVEINGTNFPDTNFRDYVKTFDTDRNGSLSQTELDEVTVIDVEGTGITRLKGVEHFTELTYLDCGKNALSSLDVSKNTALREFYCDDNKLTSLDVSKNTALSKLDCKENQLTALDVSRKTGLEVLYCSRNQLTALDVSQNTALREFYCDSNQLTSLDVSNDVDLQIFSCDTNQLTSLDVSNNVKLQVFFCNGNSLTSLDVSKNRKLEFLSCNDNQIAALDVSNNVKLGTFHCDENQLTSLDVSKNRALTLLSCSRNQIAALDVSNNVKLQTFYCDSNQLSVLDVSKNTDLEKLICTSNHLTSLDITVNTKISDFDGDDQEHDISVDQNTLTYDLNLLPGNFDPLKASGWVGGSVSGNTLTLDKTKPKKVTYEYQAQAGKNLSVTLNVNYGDVVSVTFDANGGAGTMPSVTKNKDELYALPACTFTAPEGKTFKGWEVGGTEYAAGKEVTIKGDTTVKALWNEEKPAVDGSSAAYLTGYPDGSIRPNGFVTRAESAKIIASLKGLDLSAGGQPAFKDLTSSWYSPYINAVVNQGLMRGYMDGTFKPNAPITRAEFAQMIMPLDKSIEARAPFTDVKGHWAEKAINQAYGNGRIKGYPDGTFRPDGQITRAEAVTICNNFFNRKADKAGLEAALKNPGKIKTFTDLDKSHWAYYEILEAANPHDDQKKA